MATTRSSPRVSINQLASYLTASPAKRRTILRNAKRPATFMVNWYDPARQAISAFIDGGMSNERILLDEIARLEAASAANDYEEARWRTNAEALESVLGSYDQLDLGGLAYTVAATEQPTLSIQGVEISVRPEFTCCGSLRSRDVSGGLKLYFSKEDELSDTSAPFITCIVMRFIQDRHSPNGTTARQGSCLVYDIFAGRVHAAPSAVTRRLQDIEAGCQEIALLWPTI